jgi:hypothetical protein
VLRDLADSVGLAFDADAEVAGEWSMMQFGYNLFDPTSLAGIGLDLESGAAVFGTGLSPTVVARLGDPSKLDAFVERMRENGVSLQSQMADGAEVFSVNMGGEWVVSWAVVDGWVLSRIEILAERAPELGWLSGARGAKGGLGGDPDFTAAIEAGRKYAPALAVGDPPVVTVIRPSRLADSVEAMFQDPELAACLGPVRSVPRIVGAAASSDAGVTGALVADLADASAFEALMMPPPPGWANARANAPLQVDLGVDADKAMRSCFATGTFGMKTAHLAIHHFDDDGWPDRAAAYADLSTDRVLRGLLSQIPFLGRMSDKRTIGDTEVVDVSIPMFISFTYLLTPTRGAASRGKGMMEAILGGGEVPKNEVFRLELHPPQIPDAAWHLALEQGLQVDRDSARERTIQRIRAWSDALIEAHLDDTRIVLTVNGTRRK